MLYQLGGYLLQLTTIRVASRLAWPSLTIRFDIIAQLPISRICREKFISWRNLGCLSQYRWCGPEFPNPLEYLN